MMGQQGVLEKEKKKSKTKDTEIIREFNRLFDDLVDECVDHHRRVFWISVWIIMVSRTGFSF